ncbi:MAG: hypothetical protein AAGI38_01000 [Bacteroidota bacterium]
MKKLIGIIGLVGLLMMGCTSSEDEYRYEVNPEEVLSANAGKKKQKSIEQFISILYANLFQKALSADEMIEIRKCVESIGDKELAFEIVVSNLMNRPDVVLPTDEYMRENMDEFLLDTYKRFFVRLPSEAEKAYMKNFISSDPNISAEMVYVSFALAEEYQFY